MFDKSKMVILVTGTTIEPYAQNWKECERTWIPELRKLGYNVMIAFGNPKLNTYYKIVGDKIYFAAEDTKRGLFDKSIRLPCRWILEETNYEYYFRIDSDTFVHPHRFDNMILQNLSDEIPYVDYMGCCHPANHVNPYEFQRFLICKKPNMASGCGYMVSRRAMKVAYENMRIDEDIDYEIDDWVLGRAMWENGIPLLHDSRILFESRYKVLSVVINDIPLPDIADPNSHLAVQHYMNGHMEEAMRRLGYRNLDINTLLNGVKKQ
jgi:hypothetical protein